MSDPEQQERIQDAPDPDQIEVHFQEPRHQFEDPLLLVTAPAEEWFFSSTENDRAVAKAVRDFAGGLTTHEPCPDAPVPKEIAEAVENYDGEYAVDEVANPAKPRPDDQPLAEWMDVDATHDQWDGPETASLRHHPFGLIGDWPLPTSPSEATALWEANDQLQQEYDEPPHPDELNDRYVRTVAETDCWKTFEIALFGYGMRRYFWNPMGGYGFYVETVEDELSTLEELFKTLTEAE